MKYFVVSDVHSYATYLKQALRKEGFRSDYPNHTLIVNGDLFDRGSESQEMKDFIDSLERKIMIYGNHEDLILNAIQRGYFLSHDVQNGTVDSLMQLTGGYEYYGDGKKASDFFKRRSFGSDIDNLDLQISIIQRCKDINLVEWLVDNFFEADIETNVKEVSWGQDNEHFRITGKPRFYYQIGEHLMIHGWFPNSDWIVSDGKGGTSKLDPDFDLLNDSSWNEWSEWSSGIWSKTPYWLDQYYSYRLKDLYYYLKKREVKNIYIGHWGRSDLIRPRYVTVRQSDMDEFGKLPEVHYLDNTVPLTNKVLVESFIVR